MCSHILKIFHGTDYYSDQLHRVAGSRFLSFLITLQSYKKILNYANILAIIFGVFSIIPRIGIA
jgi:hypothetical protein